MWSPQSAARSGAAASRAAASDAANTITRASAASSPALRSHYHTLGELECILVACCFRDRLATLDVSAGSGSHLALVVKLS